MKCTWKNKNYEILQVNYLQILQGFVRKLFPGFLQKCFDKFLQWFLQKLLHVFIKKRKCIQFRLKFPSYFSEKHFDSLLEYFCKYIKFQKNPEKNPEKSE